jgi:hypothetical protein
MNQEYIIEEMKRVYTTGKGIVLSDELFNEAFPRPKRPTVEDMALAINAKMGLSNHIHQGEFSHIYQRTRAEILDMFCKKYDVQHYEDMSNREHHFRFNYQNYIKN